MNHERDANADQIEFWNGEAGRKWADFHRDLDTMLDPLGEAAMARADLAAGMRVLDVGCGAGSSSIAMAHQGLEVTGMDVSAPLLAAARERPAAGLDVQFLEGDAAAYPFEPGQFDRLFSRFGVMFFSNPTAAFSHLRLALSDAGRLAFICWRPMPENAWMMVPMRILLEHVSPPEPAAPGAPGPFAFADDARVRDILTAAGFGDIELERYDTDMTIGGGSQNLEDVLTFYEKIGPMASLLADQEDTVRRLVRERLLEVMAQHRSREGVRLRASCWIVTAAARQALS